MAEALPSCTTSSAYETEDKINKMIEQINDQLLQFRHLLTHIGQRRDSPELREVIHELRRKCVQQCNEASQIILSRIRRDAEHDSSESFLNLTFLCNVLQLFLRELYKSKNLFQAIPHFNSVKGKNAQEDNAQEKPRSSTSDEEVSKFRNELGNIKEDSIKLHKLMNILHDHIPKRLITSEDQASVQYSIRRRYCSTPRRVRRWTYSNVNNSKSSSVREVLRSIFAPLLRITSCRRNA